MELWLESIVNIVKAGLETKYGIALCLCCLIFVLACFLIEFIYILSCKNNTGASFFKRLATCCALLSITISLANYFNGIGIFTSIKFVFYYNATLVILGYILYIVLKIACYFITSEDNKVLFVNDIEALPPKNNVKKIVETIKLKTFEEKSYSGYLDVEYCKELLQKLKEYSLEKADELKLEDFEVYLLNFVAVQPNESQKEQVNDYLNWLIKTLAKYGVA